jgi:predicted transcriptional regulator
MKRITVDLDDETYDALKIAAAETRMTLSNIVREQIAKFLKARQGQ